ncbi:hypothetical protein OG594_00640 [Streptomyces sp. NBC_01214]|uniref:hypothetical protein n=1 Tax=Streptomyces sp. NBC_01214 TaxID=2903777 RepID=UPI002250EF59|nr:hypothetical protein [Streptomyces sp. NBC_01214]MCX4800198.1 hypothetical protein [Streptomyces sp. NBC_01214]
MTTVKFIVQAAPGTPLIVQFEPQGTEFELAPGDYLTVERPVPGKGGLLGGVTHEPDRLTLSEPEGGTARLWNSRGKELPVFGY